MFKNRLVFFFTFLVLSCTHNGASETEEIKFSFDSFPSVHELTGEKYIYDSILNARKIVVKGNDLIVSNLGGGGSQVHILDRNTLSYKKGLGKIGQGPGEIRSGIWELDAGLNKDTFWAYDLNGKSFYEFSLVDTSVLAKRTIRQNEEWFLGYSMNWKSENEIISYMTRDSYKFGIFDTLGTRLGSIELWDKEEAVDEQTGYLLSSMYQGFLEYNPSNHILGHAVSQFENFQLIDLHSGESISLIGPQEYEIDYEVENQGNEIAAFLSNETIKGYSDIFIGNNSVFLVYIGKTSAQRRESGVNSDTIFEFDLSGNPKALYKTDLSIRSISVSEKDQIIYAVTSDKDPGIAVFRY
ncbi:TolB-like 6-blade propeller-like [Algoriphagus locisalis]|uniref:TolB-like 6-blade propeller-like n=1 Tax=Algoriphagus locisalis TaxID=305507 RepID=A0A1I7A0N9_9BACT|nr:BF3164 family lipoprotein [Algoriphagus locisalis]SFT68474.1 TolB-like 6-blade propeller-like [Algoriphagus locisalis]